ncbi:MAG TPA: EAL domain-containing protein [Mycobacteriales bacterium]|nr:EAL domain-containing protein [Mycobacteriales bacterium]
MSADRAFRRVAAGGGVLVLAALVVLVGGAGPADLRAAVGHGAALLATMTALACGVRVVRASDAATRPFWVGLTAACGLAVLAEAVLTGLALRSTRVPVPSLADAMYAAAVVPASASLLLLNIRAGRRAARIRAVVDVVVLVASLFYIAWTLLLGERYAEGAGRDGDRIVLLGFPTVAILLCGLVVPLVLRARRESRRPLALIAVGIAVLLTTDMLHAALESFRAHSAATPYRAGIPIAFLCFALAALSARPEDPRLRDDDSWLTLMVPQLPVVAAGALFLRQLLTRPGEFDHVELTAVLAVSALVPVRLFLILSENSALTRDVQAAMAEVRASEERFRSIVQGSSDVITICAADGTVMFQSQAEKALLGYSPGSLMRSDVTSFIHPDDRDRVLRQYAKALEEPDGTEVYECRVGTASGEWRDIESVVSNRLGDPNIRGVVINSRDITDRKQLERRLAHQSLHDPLTGLPNRALFRDRVHHALALQNRESGRRLGVLFIDLDGFAAINDSFGHSVGDALLTLTAARLFECVRPGDTVARLGGDEFAVLLEGVASSFVARQVADRFLDAMQALVEIDGREIFISASVGIAFDTPGDSADEVMRNADLAMYRAKARGKKRYEMFAPEMHSVVVERLELETDLRHALERAEFHLAYQPVVDLRSGLLAGVEALARWTHPTRGLVSPADFIPAAEETGLIVPMGRWVIEEACRQLRAWHRSTGRLLRMSVNISARQLQGALLTDHVATALRTTGIPASSLVLEITESMLVDDADRTMEKLQRFSDLGVSMAIDDFGTGYSSLAYLSRLPVDILKIDRTFVSGLGTHPEMSAVTSAIVALGKSLNLTVVAEGIEEPSQLASLTAMGCDYGQGYLLSRPLPAAEVAVLLKGTATMDVAQLASVVPAS